MSSKVLQCHCVLVFKSLILMPLAFFLIRLRQVPSEWGSGLFSQELSQEHHLLAFRVASLPFHLIAVSFDVDLPLSRPNIDLYLAKTHRLHVWHVGVLLALEYRINFLECLSLRLNPIDSLQSSVREFHEHGMRLTIRPAMTISQLALTMYIFHPILLRPIGMMKTNTSLKYSVTIVHVF